MRLIACLVEGVPVHDMMMVKRKLVGSRCTLLGPNSPGIISPGKSLLGYMPGHLYMPGRIGVVSRSGTFSYPIAQSLSQVGLGQSTCVGIGGDPVTGISFVEVLELFQNDPGTDVVVLVGEIGRSSEEEAAEYIKAEMTNPVIAIILGEFAPPGKQMGHAGAIITAGRGTYTSKVRALEKAGVPVARTPDEVAKMVMQKLR
jgi:succinyl-CoA synthetase alpha subunit